jgi:hypothetical protein
MQFGVAAIFPCDWITRPIKARCDENDPVVAVQCGRPVATITAEKTPASRTQPTIVARLIILPPGGHVLPQLRRPCHRCNLVHSGELRASRAHWTSFNWERDSVPRLSRRHCGARDIVSGRRGMLTKSRLGVPTWRLLLSEAVKHHLNGETSPSSEQQLEDYFSLKGPQPRQTAKVVILNRENPPQRRSGRAPEWWSR